MSLEKKQTRCMWVFSQNFFPFRTLTGYNLDFNDPALFILLMRGIQSADLSWVNATGVALHLVHYIWLQYWKYVFQHGGFQLSIQPAISSYRQQLFIDLRSTQLPPRLQQQHNTLLQQFNLITATGIPIS